MLPSQQRAASWLARPGETAGTAMANTAPARALDQVPGERAAWLAPAPVATNISGDAICSVAVVGANNTDVIIIPRPPNGMRRTFILVQNRLVGTELFFAFGREATNDGSCVGIPALGNLFLDQLQSIPQNELHIFCPIAGSIPFQYVNAVL